MERPEQYFVEGHAIVSADGMIADQAGGFPDALVNDADFERFKAALRAAAFIVMGRMSHERHPPVKDMRRLVFSDGVDGYRVAEDDARVVFMNPRRVSIWEVLPALGVHEGTLAIAGGRPVFDYFLPHYDAFQLSEAHRVVLPGGTPCFSAGHPRSVLAEHGLVPAEECALDPAAGVTLTRWRRP